MSLETTLARIDTNHAKAQAIIDTMHDDNVTLRATNRILHADIDTLRTIIASLRAGIEARSQTIVKLVDERTELKGE